MRVAVVSFYFPEYTISLANALAAEKVETLLLLPENDIEPFRQIIAHDVLLYPFPKRRLRDPLSISEICSITRAILAWQPDIIHLQHGHLWFNLVGLPLLGRKPLVTTVHDVTRHAGDGYSSRTPQWVWDIAFKRASHLIVHGQELKRQIIQRHNVPADCVHVVPHGQYELHTRCARPDLPERENILFFGRIWPYKGLQYLIQAEPVITSQVPTARIVIAGEGEDIEKYMALMTNRDSFEVHNRFIQFEEIAGFFQQAAVVVLPYIEASQSGIVPLAFAFGKPVVATNVGSIPEMVCHGETGYIVPPRNVPGLAAAVVDLLKNTSLRRRMGERAYQTAITDLSWEAIASRVCQVYKTALSN